MKFIARLILFLFLNFIALALGGLFTAGGASSEWYQTIHKAPWTPPGWVFGAAWTCVMIFFSVFMTFLVQNENFNKVLKLYIIQFILNVSWNYIFFNQQLTTLGLINIIILTILVFYFLVAFKASLKNNRFFILPYFIWLIVATSLNAYIVLYN